MPLPSSGFRIAGEGPDICLPPAANPETSPPLCVLKCHWYTCVRVGRQGILSWSVLQFHISLFDSQLG